MAVLKYSSVYKYIIKAECEAPLHIGSAIGDKGEILIHPVDDKPFIQSSSLTGVLRTISGHVNGFNLTDTLFGPRHMSSKANASNQNSRIRISDGSFAMETVKKELRPRVKIDRRTGTVHTAQKSGNNVKSGQKFNTEYIGAGAEFSFEVYLYDDKESSLNLQSALEKIFAELMSETIQIGGQKSNGGGFVKVNKALRYSFDLTNTADFVKWADEDTLMESEYTDITSKLSSASGTDNSYQILVEGKTEGSLQVKGIAVDQFGKDVPDSRNMKNAKLQYIIPGSSLKGVLRNRMEYIASLMHKEYLIGNIFGSVGSGKILGSAGTVVVKDTVVEDYREIVQHRIHVDKFTAGVISGGLFEESNVAGNLKIQIIVKESKQTDATAGLLLFALRDLSAGLFNVGSGYNVGKGFIAVDKITISHNGKSGIIDLTKNKIVDDDSIIESCMGALAATNKEER